MAMKSRPDKRPKDRDLGLKVATSIVEASVREGLIDTKGKSSEQLGEILYDDGYEFVKRISRMREFKFYATVDHMENILKQARLYSRYGDLEFAYLFYATWFEHWLNAMTATLAVRNKFTQDELLEFIRDVPFRGKLTWLTTLFQLPKIRGRHRTAILQVMERRNSFVHYKWKVEDMDKRANEEEREKRTLVRAELAVRYLRRFERRHLVPLSKRRIKRLLRLEVESRESS